MQAQYSDIRVEYMWTNLLADGGEATGLAALVDGLRDPVDPGVTADLQRSEGVLAPQHEATYSLVVGVNKDDLVVLVDTVLVHPVRVENPEVTAPPANTLLRNTPQATLGLELVDTLANGLAVGGTCIYLSIPSSSTRWRPAYPWGRASCGYHGGHGRGR